MSIQLTTLNNAKNKQNQFIQSCITDEPKSNPNIATETAYDRPLFGRFLPNVLDKEALYNYADLFLLSICTTPVGTRNWFCKISTIRPCHYLLIQKPESACVNTLKICVTPTRAEMNYNVWSEFFAGKKGQDWRSNRARWYYSWSKCDTSSHANTK